MMRRPVLALALPALVVAYVLLAGPAAAQVPNRLYGTVTLDGAAAAPGTAIQAQVANAPGKICGSTTVRSLQVSGTAYPYLLDVPDGNAPEECKPGAVLIFLVGGKTAGQTFTLSDLGSFQRLDLSAPGTPNVPVSGGPTVALARGCTDVTVSFPDGTSTEVVAAAITPAGVLDGIWRFEAQANAYHGYNPSVLFASDLPNVRRGEMLRICTSAPATLTQPA
jgi:hypothetical protein